MMWVSHTQGSVNKYDTPQWTHAGGAVVVTSQDILEGDMHEGTGRLLLPRATRVSSASVPRCISLSVSLSVSLSLSLSLSIAL